MAPPVPSCFSNISFSSSLDTIVLLDNSSDSSRLFRIQILILSLWASEIPEWISLLLYLCAK